MTEELPVEAILERLRQHPAVRSASVLPHEPPKNFGGLQCRLWCKGCAARSSGIENVQFSATRTTLTACLAELEKKLAKHGANCEARAAAAKAAAAQQQSAGAGSSGVAGSPGTAGVEHHDAGRAMMAPAGARARAAAANKEALAAEKAKDAAEAEVEALEAAFSRPKKARTEPTPGTTADEDGPTVVVDDWTLGDHRRESTRVQNRRAVEICSRKTAPSPRTGKLGFLHHGRHGLIGAVAYWAGGVTALAVYMLVAVIVQLNIVEAVPPRRDVEFVWKSLNI